ncbi:ribosome recycling factor [bacterium]|nr:ribosome recycling factor [bacterium]
MEEEVELLEMEAREQMQNAIDHFKSGLQKIRAGKANPDMLTGVMVEAYGTTTALNAVATVNAPDARTISIQPFDRGVMGNIERAIINSNLGFNPMNDGTVIRISIPPLTEERRQQLVKMAKSEMEIAKVSIRNARKEANEGVKKLVKDGLSEDIGKDVEAEIQNFTNEFTKRIEELFDQKEKDIMTI